MEGNKGGSGKEAVGETTSFSGFVLDFYLYQMPENKSTMDTFHSLPIYTVDSVYLWWFSCVLNRYKISPQSL